jgi:hypothetical protein
LGLSSWCGLVGFGLRCAMSDGQLESSNGLQKRCYCGMCGGKGSKDAGKQAQSQGNCVRCYERLCQTGALGVDEFLLPDSGAYLSVSRNVFLSRPGPNGDKCMTVLWKVYCSGLALILLGIALDCRACGHEDEHSRPVARHPSVDNKWPLSLHNKDMCVLESGH